MTQDSRPGAGAKFFIRYLVWNKPDPKWGFLWRNRYQPAPLPLAYAVLKHIGGKLIIEGESITNQSDSSVEVVACEILSFDSLEVLDGPTLLGSPVLVPPGAEFTGWAEMVRL